MWLRASLPRMRYDRLMSLGWKYLIEIAILWVLVSTAIVVVAADEHWNRSWSRAGRGRASRSRAYGDAVRSRCRSPASTIEEFR